MSEFPKGEIKHRRIRHSLNELVSLKQYCNTHNYSHSAVLNQVFTGKIIAYKICGRWWVVPNP